MGMLVKEWWREKKYDQDMIHIKTQRDLLTKHLLAGGVKKINDVGS